MAITIQQNPFLHSPAYNPMDFVVTSDETAQANFRYVCDLYITGVTPAYFRLFADKDPQFGSGHFDIHRVIENFVSGDIALAGHGFQGNPKSFKKYQCKFGESYGPSSGVIVYADDEVDDVRYAWNGIMDFVEFKNYVAGDYLLTSSAAQFLTLQPSSVFIGLNENAYLYMIANTSGTPSFARVRLEDINEVQIMTYFVSNPFASAGSNDNHKFLRFGCGTKNLKLIAGSLIYDDTLTLLNTAIDIPSNTYFIKIRMVNAAAATRSTTMVFKIKEVCSKDTSVRLHFLNKLGGFDSFTFNMSNKQSATINRSKYKRIQGGMTSANSWAYGKSDSLNRNFDINIQDKIHLVSDWINEATSIWLEELITSPWVLIDDATDGLISVNILNTQYNRKKNVLDKVFNLEIDIEYTYKRSRQRL